MRRHSTIDSLYQAQVQRFKNAQVTAEQGFREIAEAGRTDLVELTSGRIDKRTLAKLGHPFGRGASAAESTPSGLGRGASRAKLKAQIGRGKLPYMPINVQSGQLRRTVHITWSKRRGSIVADVGSSAPHNKYILFPAGTRKMVGRGVLGGKMIGFRAAGALEKRWAQRKKAWRERFISKQRQ